MPKPSLIYGTIVSLCGMIRTYSKVRWERRKKWLMDKLKTKNVKFSRRLARRSHKKRMGLLRNAWRKVANKDGSGFHIVGGSALKRSAAYMPLFCDTLVGIWSDYRFELPEPEYSLGRLLGWIPFPMRGHSAPATKAKKAKQAKTTKPCVPKVPESWNGDSLDLYCLRDQSQAVWDNGVPRCITCQTRKTVPVWPDPFSALVDPSSLLSSSSATEHVPAKVQANRILDQEFRDPDAFM